MTKIQELELEIESLRRQICCKTKFYDNNTLFPTIGSNGVLYVDSINGTISIWNGTSYDVLTGSGGAISGSKTATGTTTTTFTVTIGTTQPSTSYYVNITPTNALSAALFYVTNKTTTTFDVEYLAGLTGSVAFDWSVNN